MLTQVLLVLASIVAVGIAKETQYTIIVETGDQFYADTDANLNIILNGTRGHTSRSISLDTEGNDFERDSRDVFNILAEDIGEPLSVEFILDDHGHSPNWFLKKFLVRMNDTDKTYAFNCDCWVHPWEDRILLVEDNLWFLAFTTSNVPSAGTDGPVSVVIHGDKGHSRSIILNNPGDDFERGETSRFQEATIDIGIPTNISITTGSDGKSNSWHLDSVELVNPNGEERYVGKCDCWFDTDNPEGKDSRVITLEAAGQ